MFMRNIIKCPYCNYEYVPSEIYMPNEFLGKPKNVYRDVDGRIEKADDEQHLEETFCCESCNKTFKVSAKIEYESEKVDELDFDTDFEDSLYGNDRITLEE